VLRLSSRLPLGLTLSGLPAVAVTRAYHLYALHNGANRLRVAADWALDLVAAHQIVQLGFLRDSRPSIQAAEDIDIYAATGPAPTPAALAPAPALPTSPPATAG